MMLTRFIGVVALIQAFTLIVAFPARSDPVNIAIMTVAPEYIDVFNAVFDEIEAQHPELSIRVDYYSSTRYKRDFEKWIEDGTYDLLHWSGDTRLHTMVNNQLIVPIDTLISAQNLHQNFQTNVINTVTHDDFIYALPMAQYTWGFYYSKPLFAKLGLSEPQNWEELIQVASTIKTAGTPPFVQPVKEYWPMGAWFDYVTISAGGHTLHENLTSDSPNLSTQQQGQLIAKFSDLLGHGYFYEPTYPWKWTEGLPNLVRGNAAMLLMGQFVESWIPEHLSKDVGFFPLPLSGGEQIGVMDLWVVARATKLTPELVSVLENLASPSLSKSLALGLDWLPVTKDYHDMSALSEREIEGATALINAPLQLPYFDRDARPDVTERLSVAFENAIILDSITPFKNAITHPFKAVALNHASKDKQDIEMSVLSSLKGTHVMVHVFRDIYAKLGYNLNMLYVNNDEELELAYELGLDGEMLRQPNHQNLKGELIRIEESFGKATLLLICNNSAHCREDKPVANLRVATGFQSRMVTDWANTNDVEILYYRSSFAMWRDLAQGKIDAVFSPDFDYLTNPKDMSLYSTKALMEIELYHYIHKRHAHLAPYLEAELRQLNELNTWNRILADYTSEQ